MTRKLMKASKWAAREFHESSIPDIRTVKRWVENGIITGRIINDQAFVFEDVKFGVSNEISRSVERLIMES